MDATYIDIEKGRTEGDGMEEVKATSTKLEQRQTTVATEPTTAETTKANTSAINSNFQQLPASSTRQQQTSRKKESGSSSSRKVSATNSGMPLPGLHTLYRRPEIVTRSIAPVVPKGELIPLKPRLIGQDNKVPEHKKSKPPKFIPYEPYPGAVSSMEACANKGQGENSSGQSTPHIWKKNRNNLDIGELVNQMSTLRTQELKDGSENGSAGNAAVNEELEKLRGELKKVCDERDHYQGQFKFQTQVNAELKNLLVASVGEDLQTRVNVLTEDKLQLARALLDTANNLTTHTEQIEFLAGQSEVWRSKFLASSVMVEELARWKADLSHKNQMLNEATKRLLQSMHQLRDMQLDILKNLKFVSKIRYLSLPATDVFTLSAENLNILQQMVLHTSNMHGIPEAQLNISSASKETHCEAEKYASQALELVSQPLMATDEAIRALFWQTQKPYGPTGLSNEDVPSQMSSKSNEGKIQNI